MISIAWFAWRHPALATILALVLAAAIWRATRPSAEDAEA